MFAYQNLDVFLTSAYDADFRVLRCQHVKPVTSSSEKCSTHGVSGNVSANLRLFYTVIDGQYKMTTRSQTRTIGHIGVNYITYLVRLFHCFKDVEFK